jgi:hypothetical protein
MELEIAANKKASKGSRLQILAQNHPEFLSSLVQALIQEYGIQRSKQKDPTNEPSDSAGSLYVVK